METVRLTLSLWKDAAQTIWYGIAAISAVFAYCTYRNTARLEQARWTVRMYEKFYEVPDFKKMRAAVDCDSPDSEEIVGIIETEPAALTDYLNFFELLAILKESKQMKESAVEDMFGYYLDKLQMHGTLLAYIHDVKRNGFEKLSEFLKKRKQTIRA